MSQPHPARQHGGRLFALSCVLLCGLVVLSSWAWRAAYRERRGIERRQGDDRALAQGINVDLGQYGPEARERALDDIEGLGIQWVRQRFSWREVEPEEGVYDWTRWDAVVEAVGRHELELIAVLDGPPDWALRRDPVPLPCDPPARAEAYARFVAIFTQRYGRTVGAYQIWDEPNLSQAWGGGHVAACGYVTLLEAAYGPIHESDPSAIVLGGGLAPTQATGPADLNDLVYLEQLYALGGGAYFDVLAVKGYGFWSGPEDRRVAPDILNLSRLVAVRELARRRGDAAKPIWAVEWGWHVTDLDASAAPPPWGTDTLEMQRPRILGAVERARHEWSWLDVMCWAEYQPDRPPGDPRWGFALRDSMGQETALHAVLQQAVAGPLDNTSYLAPQTTRPVIVGGLLVLGYVDAGVIWLQLRSTQYLHRVWRWWRTRPWPAHLATLAVLALLVAITPWPEWVAIELVVAATVLCLHPQWGLLASVATIPLFYASKVLGDTRLAPSEILIYLTAVSAAWHLGGRRTRARSALDLAWLAWVAWGVVALARAPSPVGAWQEWRLTILDPALLYLLLSLQADEEARDQVNQRSVATTWILAGSAVAVIGILQWWSGTRVPSGSVGRTSGVYYSPNHLALYLERVWPVALSLTLRREGERRPPRWVWAALVVIGTGLYLTYSRGAWLLAVPVSLAVLGWHHRRRLRWWVVVGVLAAVVLVASNVVLGRATAPAGALDEIRIHVWQSTVQMVADHPWLGVGLDGFRTLYPRYMQPAAWTEPTLDHPHNMWLDAAVRTGLPGLVLFAVLVLLCLRSVLQWSRRTCSWRRALAAGCVAVMLGGLAHGLVDSGYFLPDLAWSMALMAGLARMGIVQRASIERKRGV